MGVYSLRLGVCNLYSTLYFMYIRKNSPTYMYLLAIYCTYIPYILLYILGLVDILEYTWIYYSLYLGLICNLICR